MTTDQKKPIVRVDGKGQISEATRRISTNLVSHPKPPARRKPLIIVALIVATEAEIKAAAF